MDEGESATIYSREEKGKAKSSDNLFGYIIREDYENAIKEIAQTEFPDVKVYVRFDSSSFDDSLRMDSTLEDAYATGEKLLGSIWVLVNTEESQEDFMHSADKISEILKTKK